MAQDPFERGASTGGNESHRIDDLDKRLYRRDLAGRKEKRIDNLSARVFPVARDWKSLDEHKETVEKVATHPTFFKKFFVFSLGFAALAIIFVVITFFTGGNTVSNSNIDLSVVGNSFTAGGDQLPLEIRIANKNATSLQLADVFVEYDKGGDASGGAQHVRDDESLGTIPAGQTVSKNVFVTLYGQEGSTQDIDLTLQYRISGSNAIFVKTSNFPVTISSAPIALSSDLPKTVTPNQPESFTVKVVSNSKSTVSDMLLHVDYPAGFQYASSTPNATSLNDTWNLGDMAPGAEKDITISGTIFGQDGDDRAFHISTGAASASDATQIGLTYNSLVQVVSLVKPFLEADLAINGATDATVPVTSNSTVNVSVRYANNLPTEVTNAVVTVSLSGNAYDPNSVTSNKGFYDSSNNTVTWDQTSVPALAAIEPADAGTLDFSFKVKPLYAPGQSLIINPAVSFSVSIQGKQPDASGAVSQITGSDIKTALVTSDLGFSANAFYTSGPFANTGPIPPAANQPTTYTVTWTVTNSSNPLTGGVATAQLPTYVDWIGTTSPSGETMTYDDSSRTVSWNIGQIAPGVGTTGAARAVSFQVRLNPSVSQVGSEPALVLPASVTAKDSYTGETVTASRPAVSTQLDNDAHFPEEGGVVTK